MGLDICLTGYPALVLGQKGTIYPAKPDIPFDMDIRPKIGRLSDICAGYPARSPYFRPDPEFDFQPDIQSNIQNSAGYCVSYMVYGRDLYSVSGIKSGYLTRYPVSDRTFSLISGIPPDI